MFIQWSKKDSIKGAMTSTYFNNLLFLNLVTYTFFYDIVVPHIYNYPKWICIIISENKWVTMLILPNHRASLSFFFPIMNQIFDKTIDLGSKLWRNWAIEYTENAQEKKEMLQRWLATRINITNAWLGFSSPLREKGSEQLYNPVHTNN